MQAIVKLTYITFMKIKNRVVLSLDFDSKNTGNLLILRLVQKSEKNVGHNNYLEWQKINVDTIMAA
ncbi:hypothetical protein BpHYR1_007664 [Brachionus plicatilis]|uniref:Uncharacterized protein n=1 Tax=Brachionus plicatilis TaxID=10195 RepID=A0A3M7T9M0_BRAPC|nr:hypothetical protein BpHYR1_007664 [Brachionus plicatilis]